MGLRSKLMEVPFIYDLFVHGLTRSASRTWFVQHLVQLREGARVLDVGCGTASILFGLSEVDYVGIDHNPEYIEKARTQFGERGKFHCLDINDTRFRMFGTFDVVLVLGVLHHLTDHEAAVLMERLPPIVNPDGVVITYDCAIVSGQHPVARLLARLDRGRHARRPEQYRALLERQFVIEHEVVRHDLLKVPYTHAIFRAKPKVPATQRT